MTGRRDVIILNLDFPEQKSREYHSLEPATFTTGVAAALLEVLLRLILATCYAHLLAMALRSLTPRMSTFMYLLLYLLLVPCT